MSTPTPHLSPEAKNTLPQHVAVIMDGNGRWAKQHGLPRIEGHRRGADSAREIIRTAGELGIKYLTLYAFSAENWNRPKDEVDALMKYLVHYLKTETSELNKNNVRLEVIGQIYRLPENVQEHLKKAMHTLARNNGLTLIMALSYGSRIEIVEAARSIATKVREGKLDPADINERVVSENLWTRNFPDPDVLIRTSGEMRVSNFLLWQISYAELVITPTLWPDFGSRSFIARWKITRGVTGALAACEVFHLRIGQMLRLKAMTKIRWFIFSIVMPSIGGAILLTKRFQPPPTYQGRSVAEWMMESIKDYPRGKPNAIHSLRTMGEPAIMELARRWKLRIPN